MESGLHTKQANYGPKNLRANLGLSRTRITNKWLVNPNDKRIDNSKKTHLRKNWTAIIIIKVL